MEGPKNALPQEGLEKCTPKPADACDISRRERWLLAVTFAFCLLTVNTLFDAGAGAGWAAAVAGWYAVLYASHGPALWRTGESRFLLVTNLALALFSLVLGSSDYFRMWGHPGAAAGAAAGPHRGPLRRAEIALVAARHAVGAGLPAALRLFQPSGGLPRRPLPRAVRRRAAAGLRSSGLRRGGGPAGRPGAVPGVGGRAVRPRHRGPPGPPGPPPHGGRGRRGDDALFLQPGLQPPAPQAPAAAGGKAPAGR